jgi:hypothetical protein
VGDSGVDWKFCQQKRRAMIFLKWPGHIPLGAAKWMTLPSDLNMLTSSIAWMGWVPSFFRAAWSFLSSAPDLAGARLTLRRGVPFPLHHLY